MKKILCGALIALAGLFTATAQELPQLPADTAVITGVLPNGLTYYIRHNETPKGQADFHIAQKVGSILEEDNQRGLAHFLEHMCFNGTKNFPGNSLISYLESIGVKFGSHLNAYTGTDETVYKITNVPTQSTAVTDSVLLILHDWANELLLDPEEIDKERGVIHEEWRQSNVGQMRILEQLLPTVYAGSKYGHRLPIGTMEVVDNFPYQALRDYYEAWYRPDQQGIVVVGDIDAKRTEDVIKRMFSDIEMPANAPMRLQFDVPDTPGTIYAIGSDKEQTNSIVYLIFKQDPMPREYRNTPMYPTYHFMQTMIGAMLNQRFADMMSKPETPFAFAQAEQGNFIMANTKDMFAVIAAAKDNDIAPTLQSVYREVLRAQRGGFTQSELDRAKADFLASIEKAYNNRETIENGVLTQDLIRNFIDGTPMMDVPTEYQLYTAVAQMVDLKSINEMFKQMITDDNRVVLCLLPDNAVIPTESSLDAIMKSVDAEEIEVFKDAVREDPLIPALPSPGSILSVAPLTDFEGTETWTLSNGARVLVKKTDFKNDEIIFMASAPGGVAGEFQGANPADVRALMGIYSEMFGMGSYTNSDLSKYLAGKKAGISPSYNAYDVSLSGSTTPKDLQTQLELVYAYFTSVSYPADEFEATRQLYAGLLQNQEANPQYVFARDVCKSLYTSPMLDQLSAADMQACSRSEIQDLARKAVSDASQWTFVFVGNYDEETLKTLCAQYLATLPSTATAPKRVTLANPDFEIKGGTGTDTYTTPMETPQTYCAIVESATIPFTSANAKMASIAGQILSARLLKTVREEMGAVYSIGASGDLDAALGHNAQIMTSFPMNPEKKAEVLEAIAGEFRKMAEEITPEELNKVKEFMVKSYTERKEQNPAWAGYLQQWSLTGKDLFSNAVSEVNAITPESIEKFVGEMNAQGNYRVVILEAQP